MTTKKICLKSWKSTARKFDQASVLFTDFKGFSFISEQLSPEALVTEIDHCYRAFDKISEKHKVEKIKTSGDAYRYARGLPEARQDQSEKQR